MKLGIALLGLAASFGVANATPISFDFSDIAIAPGSTTNFSTGGDKWRANNVTMIGGVELYAIFEITMTSIHQATPSASATNKIRFVQEFDSNNTLVSGPRLRMRFNNSSPAAATPLWAKVNVKFYDASNHNEFSFTAGDSFLTQFDDLDSDPGANYSDLGGIRTGDFDTAFLYNPTNLIQDTTTIPGYRIGILEQPWTDQGNETSTDPAAQAPYTIAFRKEMQTAGLFSFNFVMGYNAVGASSANRHVDMDMTGILIPEPGTLILSVILMASFGGLHLLKRRKQ